MCALIIPNASTDPLKIQLELPSRIRRTHHSPARPTHDVTQTGS
eukprot:gene11382-7887_t